MKQYVAIYLRLSKEDKDGIGMKDESNSIRSQRLVVQEYIKAHADFENMPVLEFVDDGLTGANFDRPQFQKMLMLIRAGEISCVVVKDLSRFGRNYLEVGDYLEHVFPLLNVRFVSVNDGYDSAEHIGSTGGINVAFRNLVYQQYSQDLSEKIKSSMHMKMAKGEYITHCPYGYRKVAGSKHKMEPDPATAPIVREIFLSAISGMKSTEIAAMLNEKEIPTPMEYKKISREKLHNRAMWSHQAILRILRDYKYTGAMVNFKCENETIRAKVQKKNKPDQWMVIEGKHEGIVTHDEYKAANSKIGKRKKTESTRKNQQDRVYYCAYCGRRLRKTFGLDEYYSCVSIMYQKNTECASIRWSRSELEEVVLTAYKAQLTVMQKEYRKESSLPKVSSLNQCRQKIRRLVQKKETFSSLQLQLYEQYKNGEFDAETFLFQKNKLTEEKKRLELSLVEERRKEELYAAKEIASKKTGRYLEETEKLLQMADDELKMQMYQVIDKVIVFATKEIEIRWSLPDDFRSVINE